MQRVSCFDQRPMLVIHVQGARFSCRIDANVYVGFRDRVGGSSCEIPSVAASSLSKQGRRSLEHFGRTFWRTSSTLLPPLFLAGDPPTITACYDTFFSAHIHKSHGFFATQARTYPPKWCRLPW